MKRILIKACLAMIVLSCQVSFAKPTGLLFNVTSNIDTLNINTTIPNHTYQNAGIILNTPGYSLTNAGIECRYASTGYCLFSVSDTQPKAITITKNMGTTANLNVTLCLNGNGPLSCQNYTNLPISSGPRYAYVTIESGSVSFCRINQTNGTLFSCVDAGGSLSGSLQGITLNSTQTTAYVTNFAGSPSVYQCTINPNGTFNFCTPTTITNPAGSYPGDGMIVLNPSNTIAYMPNNNFLSILACPMVAGLIQSTCTNTGVSPSNLPENLTGLTLNSTGTTAYIAGSSVRTGVTVCDVNASTFSSCVYKTGGGSITFHESGDVALNSTGSILYVTDYLDGAVYGCSTTPNNTSTFGSCFTATTGITHVWGVTLNAANTIAYVTDMEFGNVYSCPILPDGTFGTCIANSVASGTIKVALSY